MTSLLRKIILPTVAVALVVAGCTSGDAVDSTAITSTTLDGTSAATTTVDTSRSTATGEPGTAVEFDVQGHRGARGLKPENTLPAFETALDLGVDTLELDLHFTSDGQVVVWHDPIVHPDKCRLDPDQGGSAIDPQDAAEDDIAIAGFARDELAAYRCDQNPDSGRFPKQEPGATALAGDAYQIITLGELFDFVATYVASGIKTPQQQDTATTVLFNVETKRVADRPETINDGFDGTTPGPFEQALLEVIETHGMKDRVVIQSFDHRSLRAIHSVDESIRLAALTSRNVAFSDDFATFAAIWSPDYRALSASSLENAHGVGLLVIPWTVNEATDMTRLIELGVDGLISDRPDLAVSFRPTKQ